MRQLRALLPVIAATFAVACGSSTPFEVNGVPSRSFSLEVGGLISIELQTIGPGAYASPPSLNGAAIHFLEVTTPDGIVAPAGVKQAFHFKGVSAGRTIIVFHNEDTSHPHSDVIDTVIVR